MSKSEADDGRGEEEDDCPLCYDPLPPFWDTKRRVLHLCCGKYTCKDCRDKKIAVLERAAESGTWGKAEDQLDNCCPLCRTKAPDSEDIVKLMRDKFDKGQLPLTLYHRLGMFFLKGWKGVEIDIEKGVEILMLGAENGDPHCQNAIGYRCRDGADGLPKSTKDAKRWFLAATEQGHADAEYNLAFMAKDEGNDAEYLRYLRGSASKGHNEACFNLGLALFHGEHGAQKSTEEAIRVLTPAAERGDATSMSLLGYAMCTQDPDRSLLPPDNPNFAEGLHWARRAAATGDEGSISNSGRIEEGASRICFRCYKRAPRDHKFLRCSRCRAAWYCSKDCQRRHWKGKDGHKKHCVQWV